MFFEYCQNKQKFKINEDYFSAIAYIQIIWEIIPVPPLWKSIPDMLWYTSDLTRDSNFFPRKSLCLLISHLIWHCLLPLASKKYNMEKSSNLILWRLPGSNLQLRGNKALWKFQDHCRIIISRIWMQMTSLLEHCDQKFVKSHLLFFVEVPMFLRQQSPSEI